MLPFGVESPPSVPKLNVLDMQNAVFTPALIPPDDMPIRRTGACRVGVGFCLVGCWDAVVYRKFNTANTELIVEFFLFSA